MRKRIVVLLAMVVMAVAMLATAAPVFAQGVGGCDPNPGQTEDSRSRHTPPPKQKPGAFFRSSEANEHNENTGTGYGEGCESAVL